MIKKKNKIAIEESKNNFFFNNKNKFLTVDFNRIAFLFFLFTVIILLYSLKLIYLGGLNSKLQNISKNPSSEFRADIIDNNGTFVAKSVRTFNVGVNPKLIREKKNFIIKLKLIFPKKDFSEIEKKIKKNKFFYIEKRISSNNLEKIRMLGEKSIIIEEKIARIYPQKELLSHIIGQIDDGNKGISGVEKSYDEILKSQREPLKLTIDSNIQHLIREELLRAEKYFKNVGSSAILMNIHNGEILSMISLPDFDINKRDQIKDKRYINRSTKGVYELGSVFKTFTIASALDEGVIETETKFQNLEKTIFCGGKPIREYDEKLPSNLTAEEILIRSGNIGSVKIAQRVGLENYRNFLKKLGILDELKFDILEVGKPLQFNWGKCKLATVSFGHGITITPLHLAKGYSVISNGGYDINPTIIKKENNYKKNKKIIQKKDVSQKINKILRKIVNTKDGTAGLADVEGYEIGGKTGTAQQVENGVYSRKKINTFASIFPISNPKYVLIVLLEAPKTSKDYIYKYRNKPGTFIGTPFNTAGWTSVEITGRIIEKIGPILAIKYLDPV